MKRYLWSTTIWKQSAGPRIHKAAWSDIFETPHVHLYFTVDCFVYVAQLSVITFPRSRSYYIANTVFHLSSNDQLLQSEIISRRTLRFVAMEPFLPRSCDLPKNPVFIDCGQNADGQSHRQYRPTDTDVRAGNEDRATDLITEVVFPNAMVLVNVL